MTVGTQLVPPTRHVLEFGPESMFLCRSANRLVHAVGVAARLPTHRDGGWATLADRVRALLAEREPDGPDLVVGALPFAEQHPGELIMPTATRRDVGPTIAVDSDRGIGRMIRSREVPAPEVYRAGVAGALDSLRDGRLDKVVLARTVELTVDRMIDINTLLARLAARDPRAHTFAVRVPDQEDAGGATLIGASPELLVAKAGRVVRSHPLAGSAARSADPVEDRRRAEALAASAKDAREHAMVVDMIVEGLRPFCTKLAAPAPELVRTATMWHLGTRITGRLTDPTVGSVELATALHPTPAVCGWPTEPARSLIEEIEPFDRGHYTGTVGWSDTAGDGEWLVSLRCSEIRGAGIRLFAGAGVIAESDPAEELAETSAKLRTLYQALGLEGVDPR